MPKYTLKKAKPKPRLYQPKPVSFILFRSGRLPEQVIIPPDRYWKWFLSEEIGMSERDREQGIHRWAVSIIAFLRVGDLLFYGDHDYAIRGSPTNLTSKGGHRSWGKKFPSMGGTVAAVQMPKGSELPVDMPGHILDFYLRIWPYR